MADFAAAIAELNSILSDTNTPVEIVHSGARLLQRETELVVIVPVSAGTPTDDFILTFQATNLLLKYITALRAHDWQAALILEHEKVPPLAA